MTRSEILDKAKSCVCGQREQDYGKPEDNFATIAALWSDYKDVEFTAEDVAVMMALMKIARIKTGTATDDCFVDLAGYAACGGEIAGGKGNTNVQEQRSYTAKPPHIILDSYGECEAVLDRMRSILNIIGVVTVADLYHILGNLDTPNADYDYGWRDIRSVGIRPKDGKYEIKFSVPVYLNSKEDI